MAGAAVHVITAITDDDRLVNGVFNIAEPGVANQLGTAYCYDLIVQASPLNVGTIDIGGINLTGGSNGIVLGAGDSMPISAQNLSQIYVAGSEVGDNLTYMYFTYRKAAQP